MARRNPINPAAPTIPANTPTNVRAFLSAIAAALAINAANIALELTPAASFASAELKKAGFAAACAVRDINNNVLTDDDHEWLGGDIGIDWTGPVAEFDDAFGF